MLDSGVPCGHNHYSTLKVMNGHMVSMLHSKIKLAEQLIFSIDVAHTVGMLSS